MATLCPHFNMNGFSLRLVALYVIVLAVLPAAASPPKACGKIELLRDTWGIPHVFSETDAGAMYGLG